jgi:hypothetical protein
MPEIPQVGHRNSVYTCGSNVRQDVKDYQPETARTLTVSFYIIMNIPFAISPS